MRGEIGLSIKEIEIRKFGDGSYEMTFYDNDRTFLHIVGDNDLESLLTQALKNIRTI